MRRDSQQTHVGVHPGPLLGNDPGTSRRTVPTPLGDMTIVARDGHLVEVWWPRIGTRAHDAGDMLDRAAHQIEAYFAGRRQVFDLPLRPAGTPFQLAVWRAVAAIPYGETRSYGQIARDLGRPTAARAVGRAVGLNPLPVLVPCHRVVGSSGGLTGYAGGLPLKQRLLAHETSAGS